MYDKDVTVDYSESRYGLDCGGFDSCSYSQMTQYLTDALKKDAGKAMNSTTGEFFNNSTLRLQVANKFKDNIKTVVDKFKNRTAANVTTTDNDIKTILLKDMALSAALMERVIKGSCLKNYFSITLPN